MSLITTNAGSIPAFTTKPSNGSLFREFCEGPITEQGRRVSKSKFLPIFENKFFENIVIGVLKSKLTGHGFEPRQFHTFRQERLTSRHSTVLERNLGSQEKVKAYGRRHGRKIGRAVVLQVPFFYGADLDLTANRV